MDDDKTEGEDLDSTETVRVSGDAGAEPSKTPTSIGKYRILGKLGEGGMGVVYEAQQEHPKRKVAVKVVRGGQFVDEQRARMFQREADTLARLKHPNIGGIYESGRTEDGQHFFAMELVRGETLDRYIKKRPTVSTREELHQRLRLFRKISDAVQYAHQRGVIHRDLKPSNIIVTASTSSDPSLPEIKILDFGLARITEGDIAAATLTTEIGVIKGTLAYMAPEQARGESDEIDVRTDVYALGMILYEMLSGTRPYDVMHKALAEAVRVICEEPPKSLKQTISGIRRVDPDIETIVGKALEKEAERRYASAAALSEDVGRYLTSQPILARPPSAVYQLRKFTERNRALVGGIAATFIVLVAGIVVSTVLGLREAEQRREAESARDDLEVVVEFQAGMFDGLEPDQMGRRLMENLSERVANAAKRRGASEAEVQSSLASFKESMLGVNTTDAALQVLDEDILGRAGTVIDEQFVDRPLIAARLEHTIGATYQRLGLFERSEPHSLRAVEIRVRELGKDHPRTLESMSNLANVYQVQDRLAEAEQLHLETLEIRKRVLGNEHPATLNSMNRVAVLYRNTDRNADAEPLFLKAYEVSKRVLGDEHPETFASSNNLAVLYSDQGRYDEAESLYLDTLETNKRVLGDDHPGTAMLMNNLARLYQRQGRYDEAEHLCLEILEIQEHVLGDDHPGTLNSRHNLAVLYDSQGRYAEAESLYLAILEIRRRVLGDDHGATSHSANRLAVLYTGQGRYDEAESLYLETLETRRRVRGDNHPATLELMNNLGDVYRRQGRYAEAELLHLEALETGKRVLGEEHPVTLASMASLANLYLGQGRYDGTESLYLATLEIQERVLGEDHPHRLTSINNLAILYGIQGRYDKAELLFLETLETQKRVLRDDHPDTLRSMYNLACLDAVQGNRAKAMDWLRQAVEAGWAKADAMVKDSTLGSLHGPEFDALVERARENAAAQRKK